MSKKRLDAIAVVGEYTDQQGNTKKRYSKLGSAFVNDKGEVSVKFDCVPCGSGWDGWVSLREPYDSEKPARQSSEPARTSRQRVPLDFESDAPF